MSADVKTLIIVELKSGNEKRIESPEEAPKLLEHMRGNQGIGFGFIDVDGSIVMFNVTEFETIIFIPQKSK